MELRPWLRPSSIASRNGSHKLVDGTGLRGLRCEALNSTPNPVVTAFSLAGFAVLAFAFPLVERFSGLGLGLGLTVGVGFVASDPVVTSFSRAGFAAGRPPPAPRGPPPSSRPSTHAPGLSPRPPCSRPARSHAPPRPLTLH